MNSSRLNVLLAASGGVALCVLIAMTGPQPLEASVPLGKPVVSVTSITRLVEANSVTGYGTLNPRQSLQLTTQLPGEIIWVSENLKPGGQVAEDEPLLRIDERDYVIALARSQAAYEQAQANIDLEEGRSEVARLEWSSWQEGDRKDAKASPLALRVPQQAQARAALKVIHADLEQAKLAVERTSIQAPWPAVVVQASTVEGQVLSPGEITATLFPLDYGVVEVQVPVSTLRFFDKGIAQVELRPVNNLSVAPVIGTLDGIVPNLTNETRLATIRVRVNQPLDHEGWAYGIHLQARIVTASQRDIAQISGDLIVGGNVVWVYRNGKAWRHRIDPIQADGQTVSVVDNFGQTDALILERPIGLFDGAEVELVDG